MQWSDQGIVLGVRRHGESSAILELMTRDHGRHLGLVRGGAGSRLRAILQPGNSITAVWRARLDEHLGNFSIEGTRLRAATILGLPYATYAVTHLAALCRLLPERDPHAMIYDFLEEVLDHIDESIAMHVVQFEFILLAELGFALDIETCTVTGTRDDLIYVSPKSGRAVSRMAGQQWKHKLLRLPEFLHSPGAAQTSSEDIADGFTLTGYFLADRVLEPRALQFSEAREAFITTSLRDYRRALATS